jgi:hypothetical protein
MRRKVILPVLGAATAAGIPDVLNTAGVENVAGVSDGHCVLPELAGLARV